jgi:dTDP-4-dehydrorhamnose reductase
VRVVDDQRGAPTSSRSLARLVRELLDRNGDTDEVTRAEVDELASRGGLYHATAAGETSWFGFAQAIFADVARRDRAFRAPRVLPIPTSEYPTPAKRPAYSVLSSTKLRETFGVGIPDWRIGLEESISALPGL